jgi:23S rRNA (cytidine1920-2'-O)/16S rRNA (cytidine1409-2'-O)-methyltransferase
MRRRLDTEMVRRGLARSRSDATESIERGGVRVAGRPIVRPATLVAQDEPITVAGAPRRFVSRGGEKLDAALDAFGIDPAGRQALDAGASTGGFTDRLLQGGAARVVAVDVGYGQLDWRLREDDRVTVMERTNARDLHPAMLPYPADLVVADLSFISLVTVLPALARCTAPGADLVLLVKPQFEAGREDVGRTGVVSDPEVWTRAVRRVADACRREGLSVLGVTASPLPGPAGNVEFFLHARRSIPSPRPLAEDALEAWIASATRRGVVLRDERGTRVEGGGGG